ncbi:MAG: Spo0B domain-containing protein [Clostridia bacterium]|nr:Spo0B domain-containing protein [Clostridia bacterium]
MKKIKMTKKTGIYAKGSLRRIQRKIFSTQLILIVTLALILGCAGIWINLHFETQKRDRNLQNISKTIADSPIFDDTSSEERTDVLTEYLDSLQKTLGDIDVISVVDTENKRLYHSNHELIGTVYDGTLPSFSEEQLYTEDSNGPSGKQRRAYAAIYDDEGRYVGFVITVMLRESINKETLQTMLIFFIITAAAVLMELMISAELSVNIKKKLLGYEPDVFTAMYKVRDNILESLAEGVIAIDREGRVQFANASAQRMLGGDPSKPNIVGRHIGEVCEPSIFEPTLERGEKEFGIQDQGLNAPNVLLDRIPIKKDGEIVGAVGILHDRKEYTRLMEDLAGTRYLVDSMRANNHDFTNKLHVILGLIQMEMYDEATSYIENITIVQRETVSKIMAAVGEPSVAALLIGKTARASELNVKFILREGCSYNKDDCPLPTETLITVIGNLIDNAFDAMNGNGEQYDRPKELMLGIYSSKGALLITADDTGVGIAPENIEKIFEYGYSTKGEGRGTGLYQVKTMVEGLGGTVSVESQPDVGTSFSVSFIKI